MPHSLKSKIKSLCYKGELSEKERDRLLEALESQPCDDAVSREVVLGVIKELPNANPSYSHTCNVVDRADLVYLVERLESVQPQRPKGKWIIRRLVNPDTMDEDIRIYECSECRTARRELITDHGFMNYCPNCGADMRGDKE